MAAVNEADLREEKETMRNIIDRAKINHSYISKSDNIIYVQAACILQCLASLMPADSPENPCGASVVLAR